MTAKEFLIRELHNLYDKYKSNRIGIKYEHRIETSTHIVEVSPISFYCDNMTYIQDEERIEEIFENQFDDNIIFITKDSLVKIKNPILVLESKITNEEEEFRSELATLLNKYSKENGSNTPDFALADYLINCLEAYNQTVSNRDEWYSKQLEREKNGHVLWDDKTLKPNEDLFCEELKNLEINLDDIEEVDEEEIEEFMKEVAKKFKNFAEENKPTPLDEGSTKSNIKDVSSGRQASPPPPPLPPEPRLYRGDGSPIKPKK